MSAPIKPHESFMCADCYWYQKKWWQKRGECFVSCAVCPPTQTSCYDFIPKRDKNTITKYNNKDEYPDSNFRCPYCKKPLIYINKNTLRCRKSDWHGTFFIMEGDGA